MADFDIKNGAEHSVDVDSADLERTGNADLGEAHAVTDLDDERFSLWSVLGVQYTLSASPIAICGYMVFTLGVGGSPYYFWCLIVAGFMQGLNTVTLAELASSFPHVAGQTYWTAVLAPPKYRNFLTYLNGAITIWGWTFSLSGGFILVGQFLTASATVVSSSYTPEAYHIFLIANGNAVISVLLNTYLIKIYPALNKFFLVFINAAVVYMIVVLLVKTNPKADARTVFLDVVNGTGWSSDGWVFFLGFLPALVAISLPDGVTHLAEELPDPQRRIPQVMIGCYLMSFGAAVVMVIVLLFCNAQPEHLLEPLGGAPIFQIAYDAWNNMGWLVTIAIVFNAVFVQGATAVLTGLSRIFWSFAQSSGLPFVKFITKVDTRTQVPLNSVVVVSVIAIGFGVLCFAPSYVLNAIYGCGGCCFAMSYGIPVALLINDRRRSLPRTRYLNLGKAGWALNVLMVCWYSMLAVITTFPLMSPVTTDNMNWSSVVFTVAVIITLVNYFVVRKTYQVPQEMHFTRIGQYSHSTAS